MKIQIASDLHLEFQENRQWLREKPIVPRGDVLVLAGDIVSDRHRKKVLPFYELWRERFSHVISVMGNHEFYRGICSYAYPSYGKSFNTNHMVLNNRSVVIDDVQFIASTLWTHIPREFEEDISLWMNDYREIKKQNYCEEIPLTTTDTNSFHELSVRFITRELARDFKGRRVVITHHAPLLSVVGEKYLGTGREHAFATDLERIIKENDIALWIFGHVHQNHDMYLHGTRLVCNPLGYWDSPQKYRFIYDFTVEV